jgi:hypothetical protein
MPLGLAHPVDARVEIAARFGEGWQVSGEHDEVDSSGMELAYRASVQGEELLLSWSYRSLADSVAPEDCRAYFDALDRAEDLMSYSIQAPGELDAGPPAVLLAFAGAVALLFSAIAAVLVFFLNPGPRPPEAIPADEPVGIGGWLVLLAIGVCFQPVFVLASTPDTVAVFDPEILGGLVLGPDGQVLWSNLCYVCVGVAGFAAMLVGAVLQIAVFFMRRRSFVPVFITLRAIDLAAGGAWVLVTSSVTGAPQLTEIPRLTGASISAVLWTLYVLRSRRVRNTFVR